MPNKYKTKDGIIDVSDYSFSELSEFTIKYPDAEEIEEDFQNGAAGTDAPATPVMPSRASIIAGVQPEATELPSESISLELRKGDQGYYRQERKKGRDAESIRREYYRDDSPAAIAYDAKMQKQVDKAQGLLTDIDPELEAEAKKIAEDNQELVLGITAETEKNNILAKEFKLGELKSRNHRDGYAGMGYSGMSMARFKSDEEYEDYLKEQLGNKYDRYKELQSSAEEFGMTLNKDNIANFATLDDASADTQAQVIYEAQKSASEIPLRNVDDDAKTLAEFYTGSEAVQKKKKDAYANAVAQAKKDQDAYFKLTGKSLVEKQTIDGVTYNPIPDIESTLDEVEKQNQIEIGRRLEAFEKNKVNVQGDIESLENIQQQLKEYSVPEADYNTPSQVAIRNDLFKKENDLLNKVNAQIIILNTESTALTNEIEQAGAAGISDAALLKSYKTMDKLANVWDSAFVGSAKMLGGGIARVFGDEETYNAAIDYNQKLQEYSEKYLPGNLTMDDDSTAWQYAGDMLVNNSPSIAVALATAGYGSVAAAGGGAVARAAATRVASRYATGAFFTMEAGGQLSNLEIGQRNAPKVIAGLKEELKAMEESGAAVADINKIKSQIQDQEDLLSLGMFQKGLNSVVYGGIAAGAERIGTLGFISNFQKYSRSVGGNQFRKLFGDAVGSRVAKNVGLLNATGIGAGIEFLEESMTLIGQNASDNIIFQPTNAKSLIEGLDGEFFRNTMVTSLAISGPSVSQNIYSQVADAVKTRKQSRREGEIRDELFGIQAELEKLDGRTAEARALRVERDRLITEAGIENTDVMLNLKDLTGSEIETVFENHAEIRRLKLEARDLDVTDLNKKEFDRLNAKAQELFNANQKMLSRGETNIEKFAKNTANPVEAEVNARTYNTYKYIAENNPGINSIIIKDKAEALAYADQAFKDDEAGKKQFLDNYGKSNASFEQNGDQIIYEEVVLNQMSQGGINARIAAVSPLHEIGHQQTVAAGLIKDDKLAVDSANELVQNILQDVQSRFEQGKITQEEMDVFNQRMSFYKELGKGKYTETNGVDADELIQLVGDFTAIGILPKSSYGNLFGAKTFINNLLQKFNGDMAPLFKINSPNDVYAFVANFQNKAAGFQIKKGIAGSGITKQQISSAAAKSNARVNLITKEQLAGPRAQALLFEEITNMVAAQIAGRYTLPPQALQDFTAEVVGRIYLAKENTKWDGRGQLSGFLGGRISLRIADVVRAEYKLQPTERQFLGTVDNLQPEDQKDLAVPEQAPVAQEKPKYRNLTQTKILPAEQAKAVEQKIISIARVLKSRLDAPLGPNASVTPIINELKRELGKAIDIEFKKMLGKKKGDELKKNVLRYKKAILENMTTTWLMQAMPFAIQKSVGGTYKVDGEGKRVKDSNGDFIFIPKYTSEWEGKTIDRAKTSTKQQGKTSGPEIVRRLPNAANKITDEQFLSYMFKDGDVIRGRKESLSKALAEEYGFDVINDALKNPDSPISQAFENNQEMLGMVIADNFVEEVSKQSERGLVKRSAIVNTQTIFRDALALEIEGDLDGSLALLETLSAEDRAAYEDITANIKVDTARYKQSIKKWKDAPENVQPFIDQYFENNSARDNKQAMKEYYQFSTAMIDALPNALVKALGADFFGAHYRYLNPKEAKSLGAKIRAKIDALPNTSEDIGFNPEDMRLIQAGSGLVGQITTNILNKKFESAQAKVDAFLEKYGEEVDALNIANKKAIEIVVSTAFDIAIAKPQQAVGFLRMLESTTNIGKSLRSLTGISDIQMTAESQAVYINTKTGQGYSNTLNAAQKAKVETGEIALNENHPNYKEAKKFIEDGSKQTLSQLLRIKGEHATPSSNFNVSVAKEYLTMLGTALQNPGGVQQVKDALIAKINELTVEFNQQLNTKVLSDLQDAKLGSTSDIGDLRLLAIPLESQNAFYDIKGLQTIGRVQTLLNTMFSAKNVAERAKIATEQKAINNARKQSYAANPKGISVYDFDDTLAFSKSQVIVNKDGKTYKITPAEFAKQGEALANEGAQFDFSEFNKVVKGTPGPLAPRLKKAIEKFGNKNIFVLTARPAESANAIHAFLKGIGLEIPLENITGLANGAPAAKAAWMVGKVSEGYNDFYFVDDHMGNVKAVKDVLNTFDVKGKVQQARVKRSAALGKDLNDMIERNKGIASEAVYSKIRARKEGAKKGRFKFFLPYGAEDFRGLTSYTLAGKGKQGEADQKFFEDNLVVPYMRGIAAMEKARRALKNDFATLLKALPGMKKRLGKQIGDTDYTVDQAVRVYLWTQQGQEVPGISKRDQKKLNSLISKDPMLTSFAQGLQTISKQDQWPAPSEHWIAGSVLKDINEINEVLTRGEYLQEFNDNVDIIFDENNLTKLEAAYGTRYVNALKNSIARMKSGRNRPAQPGAYEQQWLNWVNNSVGTIMFFNRRSAAMQMLSFANFVNWSDNNPLKAGIAFANQPAYWSAWSKIFNSDKLKERRGGLKSDVQEQEIANQAKNSKDKASAVIAYLLKIGFTPTQIADSFAIATGGATFLINRTKTYKKEGLSQAEAEAKAFEDFSAISDETQQSGDPMLVSAQQSSHLGRLVLAFQNTPMQYTRLMKKAGQDLINGRGDAKTNISKIAYYGFIQNLIFSALQNSLFALIPGFDDEEEDDEQYEKIINTKTERIVNSMVDTILRGSGLTGAVVSTLKNTINRYYKEEKKGYNADHAYTLLELANVSPPIGSKMRKVYGAIQTKKFDKDVMTAQGWDVTLDGRFNISPNYEILGSLASAGLNLPLDRALAEIDGISEALDARNTSYQRLALGLGWRTWDVKAKKEEEELAKIAGKMQRRIEGKKKAKETRELNQQKKLDELAAMTPEEKKAYIIAERAKRSASARKAAETRRRNKRAKDSILSGQ
jgi:hypothetical protein